MNTTTNDTSGGDLALDLLCGAEAIAEFLFGDRRQRRKVYHLAETTRFPVFRLGARLCARRSVLLQWIARQEERAEPAPSLSSTAGGSASSQSRTPVPPLTEGTAYNCDVPGARSIP